MANSRLQSLAAPAPRPRGVEVTGEFEQWFNGLDGDLRARVKATVGRIADRGPTLGRPDVDRIHGTRLHKLKEARVDRGTRVLFAFDSNRKLVMLVGGDKTGKWNRWYPQKIRLAERLYLDHERSNGKESRWPSQRDAGRTSSPRDR